MQTEATRLMVATKQGDREAFDELVVRLRGRAFHVARSLVGSREDAMELCQDAFLKVFRARDSYQPEQAFLPWFHRILRNTCFSFLRKNRRLKKVSLTAPDDDGDDAEWQIVDDGPGPTDGLERNETSEAFQRALARLSSRDREILALRHFKELSYREISETLELPEGTVMSRLFHARRRLREALGSTFDADGARAAVGKG
jgi:RNA polymerase sigma-70 factor (ECF subfamily)